MERLTIEKIKSLKEAMRSNMNVYFYNDVMKVFDELLEKRNAEEQGLLLRLPCRVGDVLWCTDNKKTESFIVKEFKICAYKINRVEIYFENASGFGLCLFDGTLDEGWFLTKEEAEQALARMEGEDALERVI